MVCWCSLLFVERLFHFDYGCNIFKPNPRVCRRVFPHRCSCGGPDILFENMMLISLGMWSELMLLQNVFRSICYWWVGFLYYRLELLNFPRHKVIEIWFYCLFHCSFCNELEFWCPPYDCPSEFFSSSANRLGFHIRRFDQ
jgi:hypothetical protein